MRQKMNPCCQFAPSGTKFIYLQQYKIFSLSNPNWEQQDPLFGFETFSSQIKWVDSFPFYSIFLLQQCIFCQIFISSYTRWQNHITQDFLACYPRRASYASCIMRLCNCRRTRHEMKMQNSLVCLNQVLEECGSAVNDDTTWAFITRPNQVIPC